MVTSVPFKTEIRENSNLPKGIRNVVQFGQPGEERVIIHMIRDIITMEINTSLNIIRKKLAVNASKNL